MNVSINPSDRRCNLSQPKDSLYFMCQCGINQNVNYMYSQFSSKIIRKRVKKKAKHYIKSNFSIGKVFAHNFFLFRYLEFF